MHFKTSAVSVSLENAEAGRPEQTLGAQSDLQPRGHLRPTTSSSLPGEEAGCHLQFVISLCAAIFMIQMGMCALVCHKD